MTSFPKVPTSDCQPIDATSPPSFVPRNGGNSPGRSGINATGRGRPGHDGNAHDRPAMTYAELQVTTNHSYLRGASHIEELFAVAAALGLSALGVTDCATVGGLVRAHQRAAETGVRLVPGCRLDPTDAPPLLLYPIDRAAWSRLTRLLTLGKRRAGKGGCTLAWADIASAAEGMLAVLVPDGTETLPAALDRLHEAFADRAYLAFTPTRGPNEAARLEALARLARAHRIAPLATGDVLYHAPDRRILADVLTCIREGCTIDDAGFRLDRGAEHHLRGPDEMARLLARHPDAIARTNEILDRARFSLDRSAPTSTQAKSKTPRSPRSRRSNASPGTAPRSATPTASPTRSPRSSATN